MWTGLLPTNLLAVQQQYYDYIGRRKTTRRWGVDLIGKMLRATHRSWMERNNILHLRTASNIKGLEMICLETAISTQFNLEYDNLDDVDHYLLDKDQEDLMHKPIDVLRGWLCDILIARGDFTSTRLECLQDRGNLTHVAPTLAATEQRQYMDWRRVCLTQRQGNYG